MTNLKQLICRDKPVLISFYTEWYQPCEKTCKQLTLFHDDFNSIVDFVELDADKELEIVEKYKIISIPSYLLFHQGQLVWRATGILEREKIEHELLKVRTV
jgi:thioredoxin 1